MKRKILYIILSMFFFFFNANIALADDSVSCAAQQEKIDTYYYLKDQLAAIDCTDDSNQTHVAICNDSNVRINIIVTELMKINDEKEVCSDKQDEINKIIEQNKEKCGKIFDDSLNDFVNGFMGFFYILGPILLILFGSLDFAKATVSADQTALRKAWKNFSKRLVATLLLFLTPIIVNFIINLNITDKYLSGNAYSCDFDYLVYTKEYDIKYVPKQNTTTSSGSSSIGGTEVDGYIVFKQGDPQWGSNNLLCSTSTTIARAGCAVTSVAMQIVNSGVETIEPINPGTLNKIMKNNGDCSGAAIYWGETTYATKNKFLLKDGQSIYILGTLSTKASKLKEYISQGYYPVIQVKYGTSNSSHYVAVFEVNGNEIVVGDPATGTLSILNNTSYPIVTGNLNTQTLLYYVQD